MEFLQHARQSSPQEEQDLLELESLYENRLWHQLSLHLERIFNAGSSLLQQPQIYEEFIATFEAKINQVKLAALIYLIGKSYNDAEAAILLFSKVLQSKNKIGDEANLSIALDVAIMEIKLGRIQDAKQKLEEANKQIASSSSLEAVVHSKYYQASMEYRKIVGPADEFYRAAVLFLSYTPTEELDNREKLELATDLALSALASEGIYNFGEVLATPILDALDGSDNAWLKDVVTAMNKGDLPSFNSLLLTHANLFAQAPALATREQFIREKAILLCVVNYAFERPSLERQIHFSELTRITELQTNQIERVLMKAMSLELLKGSIDEVQQTVSVTWVHPRVLDKSQLVLMSNQIGLWAERVKTSLLAIEDQTLELLS